jgi:hypothetical protein
VCCTESAFGTAFEGVWMVLIHKNLNLFLYTQMRVAHASFTCTLPDGTCIPGPSHLTAPVLLSTSRLASDIIGVLRAAHAAGSEVLGSATVSLGVRCAQ